MTFLEAKNTLCSQKLNIGYAGVLAGRNPLFSLQDIEDAVNVGIRMSWDYKLWPFAESLDTSSNSTSGSPTFVTIPNGEGLLYQSAFMVVVDGIPWIGSGAGKRNFADFMKWMSDYPTDNSKIWAEYSNSLYFNANAIANLSNFGVDVYAKSHCPRYSTTEGDNFGDDDFLPFTWEGGEGEDQGDDSDTDSSGNESIILFAYASLLSSEKKKNPSQAAVEEKKAYTILDTLWAMIAEGKAQNNPQNRPMFNSGDMFGGSNQQNRFNTPIGNF